MDQSDEADENSHETFYHLSEIVARIKIYRMIPWVFGELKLYSYNEMAIN